MEGITINAGVPTPIVSNMSMSSEMHVEPVSISETTAVSPGLKVDSPIGANETREDDSEKLLNFAKKAGSQEAFEKLADGSVFEEEVDSPEKRIKDFQQFKKAQEEDPTKRYDNFDDPGEVLKKNWLGEVGQKISEIDERVKKLEEPTPEARMITAAELVKLINELLEKKDKEEQEDFFSVLLKAILLLGKIMTQEPAIKEETAIEKRAA